MNANPPSLMPRSRKLCQGCAENGYCSHQRIAQRAVQTYLEKQLDPMGPIDYRVGSVPEFLWKLIYTCDFSGGFMGLV